MREKRDDISDNLWEKGLKVVLDSVHTHSELRPGQRDYLEFILPYIL